MTVDSDHDAVFRWLIDSPPDEPALLSDELTAPFPYFGGKRAAAAAIWERLGDVTNCVYPFCGSFADGLARPAGHRARVETANDIDGLVANVWRAMTQDPEGFADACNYPVVEVDLHARHRWLIERRRTLAGDLEQDPDYYDLRAAAWWVWGASAWIGSGWCAERSYRKIQCLDNERALQTRLRAPPRQIPEVGTSGRGISGLSMRGPSRQMPHASTVGAGTHSADRRTTLHDTIARLAQRTRYVRWVCGDWTRVVTPAVTWMHGLTGVILDPPYDDGSVDYAVGGRISSDVRAWAIDAGQRPDMRIALCGYSGEHDMPPDWECYAWRARGGYGNQGDGEGRANAGRERIWFSPACLGARQASLW